MEERIIDEEIGRKIKLKKLADGTTDVVDDLADSSSPENESGELAEGEEELTFELPDLEEDDEDLVDLSPEEAERVRKEKAEAAARRQEEYHNR